MDKRVLFVMIDGLADSGNEELGGRTYLEAANTPCLDSLVNRGVTGIVDPVETGLACGSDTAHMSIFGYNPMKLYQGRGGFETMGAGLQLDDGEIAFKCNFATLDPGPNIVTKRRVSRKFYEWGLPMIDILNEQTIPGFPLHKISVKHATEHRCGLKITGPRLTQRIEGTDPLTDHKPLLKSVPWEVNDEDSLFTSEVINATSDFIHSLLSTHPINLERQAKNKSPANILLLRGAGVRIKVDKFDEVHQVRSFFIAPTAIIKGWGMTIQSEIVEVQGATGDVYSNHQAKFDKALELFAEGFNFGFLHIKAIDDLGHDKNLQDRIRMMEKIDKLIGQTFEKITRTVLVVTGDHSTNIHIGDHSYEPVPILLCSTDSQISSQNLRFTEIDCSKGVLGRFPGSQVMGTIFNFLSNQNY